MAASEVLLLVERRLSALPQGLQDHIVRTRELAREFAIVLRVDVPKADLAAAAHDLARAYDNPLLMTEAKRLGIVPNEVERDALLLLHGPIAAEYLRQEIGCTDGGVLKAVHWYTTARVGYGMVSQIIFLADKIDPHKVTRRPVLEQVARLAKRNSTAAITLYLTDEMQRLLQDGLAVHPSMVGARNYFLKQAR